MSKAIENQSRCPKCHYEDEGAKLSVRCDKHRQAVEQRVRDLIDAGTGAETFYRWAYALNVALAKRELEISNLSRESERDWPAGQEWDDLAGTSKSIFLKKARERAGVDHDEFLAPLRSEPFYNVEDLYGN